MNKFSRSEIKGQGHMHFLAWDNHQLTAVRPFSSGGGTDRRCGVEVNCFIFL